MIGQKVFLRLRNSHGEAVCLSGWIVEEVGREVVVACHPSKLESVSNFVIREGGEGQPSIGYIRVPGEAVSSVVPAGWSEKVGKQVPSLRASLGLWFTGEEPSMESSEAEPLKVSSTKKPAPAASSMKNPLVAGLLGMEQDLFEESGRGSVGSESGEEVAQSVPQRRLANGILPPGGTVPRTTSKPNKSTKAAVEGDLLKALTASLLGGEGRSGPSTPDLSSLVMLKMLEKMEKDDKKKKDVREDSWDPHGGSGSESDEEMAGHRTGGMKAMNSLHKMQSRVHSHPRRICTAFEEEAAMDLGVIPGQAWTLKDWLKRHQWGRFKGLFRCAVMDVSAYEQLRAGNPEVAAAQLAQNIKAKVQAVLDGGDWQAAWLLTGLSDPMGRREFGGSKAEMSVVSGYLSALNKLKKQVREAEGGGTNAEDDEADSSTKTKK